MTQDLLVPDSLADFRRREMTFLGASKSVYTMGSGSAVIVMAEMPGITPHLTRFARWIRDAGFTVYVPSLFGSDGAAPSADEAAGVFRKACVSAEFKAFGGGKSSPVAEWLRALARAAHTECGGPGVGAIGMCFTGNFALTMMLEPAMLAPVLSQPSLPLDNPGGLEISGDELAAIRRRLERDNLTVKAYRFAGDSFCRAERFKAYADALGDRFEASVLPDSAANKGPKPPFNEKFVPTPHSVVTVDLIDREGEPTRRARDEIMTFFKSRLRNGG